MAYQLASKDISLLKGVGITLVIAIHLIDFNLRKELFTTMSPVAQVYNLVLYQLAVVAVPLFIFLSGYLFKAKHADHIWSYYLQRAFRLGLPYLLWTYIYLTVFYGSLSAIDGKQLTKFIWDGWSHLYFIVLTLQFAFLAPLFAKLPHKKVLVGGVVVWQFFLLWNFYYHTVLHGVGTYPIQSLFSHCIFWMGYFFLGMYVTEQGEKQKEREKILPIIGLLVGFGWMLYDAYTLYYLKNVLSVFSLSYFRPGVFLTSMSLIALLPTLMKGIPQKLKSVLGIVGDYSFGIYLMHILVMRFGLPSFHFDLRHLYGLNAAVLTVVFISLVCTMVISFIPIVNISVGGRGRKYLQRSGKGEKG